MRTLTTIGNMQLRTLRAMDRQTRLAPMRIGYMGDVRLDAAIAMNDALAAHDYNVADRPLYIAYETAAGLTGDGYPGTTTMTKLFADLKAAGIAPANVQVYAWKASGGYDGKNAPASSTWYASPAVEGPGYSQLSSGAPVPASNVPAVIPTLPPPPPPFTPAPEPGSTPSTHPVVVAHEGGSPWPWILGAAVAGGAAYGIAKWAKKRKHARRHTRTTSRVAIFT